MLRCPKFWRQSRRVGEGDLSSSQHLTHGMESGYLYFFLWHISTCEAGVHLSILLPLIFLFCFSQKTVSTACPSVNTLAASPGHFYSLVNVMQNDSFSSCSSFWLFVPRHIIPHLSALNCILSPIILSPSVIRTPLSLIAKLGDLWCLQKLSFADLNSFPQGH